MTDPILIRVSRPYPSVEAFLDAEAHLIDARGMLLVGAAPQPEGTLLRFVVSLANGEAIIKAEGKARDHEPPYGESPGGLRVAFKRYGASTKELIDRAVTHRKQHAAPDEEIDSSPRATFVLGELSSPIATEIASSPFTAPLTPTPVPGTAAVTLRSAANPAPETYTDESGVRFRKIDPSSLEAPQNRDELLGRLRQRAHAMSADILRALTKQAG